MSSDVPPGVDPAIWRPQPWFSHSLATSHQIDDLNANGGIAVSFSPHRRSPIHLEFDGSQSPSFSLWTTHSKHGFVSFPKLHSELFAIRFVTHGSMLRNNRNGESFVGRSGRATFLSFEDMLDDQASAEFSALTTTVTRQALLAACEALGGRGPRPLPRFLPVVEVTGTGMLALRQTLYSLLAGLQTGIGESDFIFSLMEEVLVYQIISAWPTLDPEIGHSSAIVHNRPIRLAIDYIESRLSSKMTLAEIANVAGIGVRALQISFRNQVGCTPVQYIINRRLEQAHEMLRSSGEGLTIRQIAMRWGFAHMSDFSRRYRQRYGCTPKTTKRHGDQ